MTSRVGTVAKLDPSSIGTGVLIDKQEQFIAKKELKVDQQKSCLMDQSSNVPHPIAPIAAMSVHFYFFHN
jgi:hypothetical protein